METKLFNFRLSIELMDAVKAKAGKTSMTDVITSLLAGWLAPVERAPGLPDDPRILELGALVDAQRDLRLKAEADRDQWRDRAKAIVSAVKPAPAVDIKRAHVSGPLLASAVPDVPGTVEWCGLKGINQPKQKGGKQ